jgi:uncharacterized protein (TIGR02145 family)
MKSLSLILIALSFILKIHSQQTSAFTDSRDGKTYKTVKIGNQVWMAENLAFKTDSGYVLYDNDSSYLKQFGYLYNWKAAQSACPPKWHLPADNEWMKMEIFLGLSIIDSKEIGHRGSIASKLKSKEKWKYDANGFNKSGFNAYPAGELTDEGLFLNLWTDAIFWTSTVEKDSLAWFRIISFDNGGIGRRAIDLKNYLSVRCIID